MPANSVASPNASWIWNAYQSAAAAGQKKKMTVTAICGASSANGSHAERKTTRFSTRRGPALLAALVRRFELAQDLVAAAHGVVQGRLRVLLAREHLLDLLLDHLAALHEVAEANALRVGGGRLEV